MAPLKLVVAALALFVATPAYADPVAQWQPHIAEASARFGIPAGWIERVIRAESGGRTMLAGRPITSRAGAMGLMQLMPGTWADLRVRLGLGTDPHDPGDNIIAGTAYLRMMYDRFGYPGMFAAYNAGPGRYAAYLAGRSRLPSETTAYLQTVTGTAAAPVPSRPNGAVPMAAKRGGEDRRGDRDDRAIDPIFFIHRPNP
ncbi:lytic transglycosylase domain-containing protein [Sphingopyxis lindanitolerans]|uniref:Lytic transglycosylase domain-containing protein n=1 Tax=Sphingopyxis lindanitolerans TaxID=2054227 RepID=A0A2S8B301_9SPHN|nr:lytic transglycosylase domain-containing protein [Sphingopyxis lindanitolerans]PQM26723.1 lytic transglycosylase domain-containing protein [Sphingopyxis lindanitolerans]